MTRFAKSTLAIRDPGTLAIALICAAIAAALFFNGRNTDLYALAGGCTFAAFIVAILYRRGTRLQTGPAGLLLILYLAWTALAITWSKVPYMSVMELSITGSGLAMYASWRLFNASSPQLPTRFFLLAFGLAFAAAMLLQFSFGFTPRAMLLNPNSAAGFLNFLWPAAAVAYLQTSLPKRARYGYLGAVFVMLVALALDGSRGASIGALVALSVVVSIGLAVHRAPRASITVIVTFAAALATANMLGTGAVGSGIESMGTPGLAGASRFTIWTAAWEMTKDHLFLGMGPGVFWLAYPRYRYPGDGSSGFYVHNDYLEFWLESGLVGLLLVIGLGIACLYLFRRTIQRYRKATVGRSDLDLATLCFAGLAGVAAHRLFTFNLQMMPFVLVTAILIAELERAADTTGIWNVRLLVHPLRIVPIVSLAVLTLIPVAHFARSAAAFDYVHKGSIHSADGSHIDAAEAFSTARMIWGQLDGPWYMHANVLVEAMRANDQTTEAQRRELVDRANQLLDEAEKRNPLRATTPLIRGLLRADHPELTTGSAEEALRKAVRLDPRNIEARYALSQVVENDGRTAEALRIIEDGLTLTYSRGVDPAPLHRRSELLDNDSPSGEGQGEVSANPDGVPHR